MNNENKSIHGFNNDMKNLTAKQTECLQTIKKASIVYLTNVDKNGFANFTVVTENI